MSDFPNPIGRLDGPCYAKARPKAHCNVDKDGSQDELLLLAKQTGLWSEPIEELIKLHLNAHVSNFTIRSCWRWEFLLG